MPRSRARLAESLILAAIYAASGAFGHLLATIGNVTPFWPPSGIALAAFLLRGERLWPGVLLGCFVETTRALIHGNGASMTTIVVGACISVGGVLEALVGARMLHRAALPPHDALAHVRGVLCFALLGAIASALGATIGTTSLLAGSLISAKTYFLTWLTWWLGDTVGILVWTPLILAFSKKYSRDMRRLETALQQLVLVGFQVLMATSVFPLSSERYPLGHFVTPFLVWAAVRLGPRGTVLSILNLSILATWATARGLGPFVHDSLNTSLLLVQAFIANITMTTLILSAVMQERTLAETALAKSRNELERRVHERTAQLTEMNRLLQDEMEQRQAKAKALQESEERYRILVEVNPDAVFVMTMDEAQQDRRILYANPAAKMLVGANDAELCGMPPSQLVPPNRREAFDARVSETIEQARVGPFEDWILRLDGISIAVEVTSAVVPWDTGKAIVVVLRDITQRKRVEEQQAQLYREAEESIRARDEFLSITSHELKTPLTSLTLLLQGIVRKAQKDPTLGPTLTPTLDGALRQTSRLNALVDNLVDVSRITQGRLVLSFADIDLTETVRDVAARMQHAAMRAGCKIRLHETGAVMGHWDRARLAQVAEKILSNAIKYGARQPIDVEVGARTDTEAAFSVRDSGIGISPEDQARIFGQFERAVSVTEFGGFGLGLWIARQIVEAHGGKIVVDSVPGQGSTFTVTLPRAVAGGQECGG